VMAVSGLAQNNVDTKVETKVDRPGYPRVRQAERLNGSEKASELIGMSVANYQNDKLGKIEDLMVDVESGRIVQVILSTGGVLGIGDSLRAAPPGAFHVDLPAKTVHLDADKEKLKSAPDFDWNQVSNIDSNAIYQVYGHYGEESAFTFLGHGDANEPLSAQRRDLTLDQKEKKQLQKDGDRLSDNDHNRWVQDSKNSNYYLPAARLGQLQRASKVIGANVKNLQDEKLGKVENLLVDLQAGRIVTVVVSSGGFLGLGDELSAVPPTAFRYTADRETLQLDASKDSLTKAPHFKASEWPNMSEPGYNEHVYRAYRVNPYFSTSQATEVDNTARNAAERTRGNLTPLDQGKSPADRTTTAEIRKQIMSQKDLSVNAKNIKIITIDGKVTLRGPVNTAEEKRRIEEIASQVATAANVDNQLEVKMTTTSTN